MARVLHTSLVAPSPAGPDLHELSLPLTYLDAMWLQASPVQRVLFYPDADATSDDDVVLSNLKDSLSMALRAFYPLAGRLRLTPGTPDRHEIHYQPGDCVTFTVAEYQHAAGFHELATDDPKEVAKIVPLVPPLPEGGAVLALQATVLRGGLAIGVTVHHAACDGASSTHFLRTWARAASGAEAAPEPPVICRTFIRERDDMYDAFTTPRRPVGPPDDDENGVVLATFTLSREHLQGVKDAVAREAERRGAPPPRATSTVAAFGFIWQCYLRAGAASSSSSRNGGRAYFLFCADHRARLEPPVPDKYLGNCVGPCFASAPRKEVITGADAGLFTACAAIAASIGDPGPGYWDGWMERVTEAYTAGGGGLPLTVAGSLRFRVYDMDFGFGRPVKVDVVSAATDGAISVAEARGGDDGGVEVGISLTADEMERFRKCFGDAIAGLSSAPHHDATNVRLLRTYGNISSSRNK